MDFSHIRPIKPNKKLGQNFLRDDAVKMQILQSISDIWAIPDVGAKNDLKIVEIGAGLGDLSDLLLRSYDVLSYEIDAKLCEFLHQKYAKEIECKKFELKNADVLKLENGHFWLCERPYILVSNLPYYVATHIILKALKDPLCKGLIVMTQKEVAQKFCDNFANALSVITSHFGSAKLLFDVPKTAFYPQPKVQSSVFSIKKTNFKPLDPIFERFLKAAFSHPRKMLLKNLKASFDCDFERIFKQLDLNNKIRPSEIEPKIYFDIFNFTKDEICQITSINSTKMK
ncbi:MAG: 16S rRNA (adenine(1518)-N(6)/adenine(1519)-N(6))-dimethyltransferase RsmA [Helicobacter sp.]|nr:16S rRNA (adenine(1518)-N(6)/adenine(1519)-N(6))-dimethyltransferase RsmA [Helicobacter sp.]